MGAEDMGQRAVRRGLKPLLMLAATIAATASARAEQLVMPFACDARGGEVRLTPSDQHAYQVYGRREHHIFTACSPTESSRCRNWMIHRFDMDCGGERVSWLKVADAARRYMRADAFVDAGKMHLRLGSHWSAGRDDPYGDRRRARQGDRYGDGAPYGGEARGSVEEIIDLPAGFAPAFGLPVSFEGGSGPRDSFDAVEGPPPAPKPYEDNARWPDEEDYTPEGERRYAQGSSNEFYDRGSGGSRYATTREAAPSVPKPLNPPATKPPQKVQSAAEEKAREPDKRADNSDAASSQKTGSTVAAGSAKSLQPGKTATKSEAPPAEAPKPAAPKAEAAASETQKPTSPEGTGTPVMPTILNAPGAAATLHAAETSPPKAEAVTSSAAPAPEKPSSPQPQAGEQHVASSDPPAKTETTIPVIGLPSASSPDQGTFAFAPWHWLLVTGAGVLLTSVAWLFLARRNNGFDAGLPRDLSAISLDGAPGANTSLMPFSEPPRPVPTLDAVGPASLSIPAKTEVRMPETLPEALEVLGASSDAGPGVLKKIVEGLRQSWHPDLARSEEDRSYREQRMAQINVAWDIIEASSMPAA